MSNIKSKKQLASLSLSRWPAGVNGWTGERLTLEGRAAVGGREQMGKRAGGRDLNLKFMSLPGWLPGSVFKSEGWLVTNLSISLSRTAQERADRPSGQSQSGCLGQREPIVWIRSASQA